MINMVETKEIILSGNVCKYIDYYELYEGDEIRRFYPKLSVWSDPRFNLLTFPYGDFPLEFTNNLPRRDGNKHRLRVRDWNTGKINEKKGGSCEDNFLDPAQGRVTGLTDIWRDHYAPVELAVMIDSIPEEYIRDEAFKFFGYVKAYSSKLDKKEQIPYELIVDFEPEDSITKAITGKINAGSIKFFGSDKIFQLADIGSLSVVSKDRHPFLKIVLKSEMEVEKQPEIKDAEKQPEIKDAEKQPEIKDAEKQPEIKDAEKLKDVEKQPYTEFIDLAIKDLKAVAQELEENKEKTKDLIKRLSESEKDNINLNQEKIKIGSEKEDLIKKLSELEKGNIDLKQEKIKIESEKEDLIKKLSELEKDRPKEGEVTFIVRKDYMSNRLQVWDRYEIINRVEINVEKIGSFIGVKMIKKDGNGDILDESSMHIMKDDSKAIDMKGDNSKVQISKEKELKFFERILESSESMYNLLLLPRASFPDEFFKLLPRLGEDIVIRDYDTGQKVYTHMDSRQYRITGLNPIWKRYPHLKMGDKIRVAIDPENREVIVDFNIGLKSIVSVQKSKGNC